MSIVTVNCWSQYCDGIFEKGKSVPLGKVIFAAPEDVKYLFEELEKTPDRKIILVSAGSDFGIHYQKESHPNSDISKCFHAIDYKGLSKRSEYVKIFLSTADFDVCKASDKFSVKIDRYTINTFDKIPNNIVKWFCANCNIDEPNIEFLPYGMNDEGNGFKIVQNYKKDWSSKEKDIYYNFQINSVVRLELKQYIDSILPTAPYITFEQLLPVDAYYFSLANHKLTLAPPGNGLDSYRIYESLLVGTIPIILQSNWAKHLIQSGFNALAVPNYMFLHLNNWVDSIKTTVEKLLKYSELQEKLLTQEYWVEKISRATSLL